jgi:hypothetical protein
MHTRWILTMATSAAVVLGTAGTASAAVINRTPEPSSHADDGTVYNSVRIGGRLFIGGSFTRVDGQARGRLAALDASTGSLTSFRLDVDGTIEALATDGQNMLFIGGKFNYVGGVRRNNIAAINVSTGTVTSFNPSPNGKIRSLDHISGKVVFGGGFTTAGGVAVTNLAAADAGSGAVDQGFPSADGVVYTVRTSGSKIYVGGEFARVAGTTRPRVAALSASGQLLAYRAALTAPVYDLDEDAAGVFLAVGGGTSNGNALVKTTTDGAEVWRVTTDGNMQSVEVVGDTVYAAGHFNYMCGTTINGCGSRTAAKKALTAAAGGTSPNASAWARFNSALGVWDFTEASGNLYALGVFTKVNGANVPRIARFAI